MSFVNPNYRVHMPSVAFLFSVLAVAGFLEFSGALVAAGTAPVVPSEIPVGLILPVTLDQTLSLSEVHAGHPLKVALPRIFLSPNAIRLHIDPALPVRSSRSLTLRTAATLIFPFVSKKWNTASK